MCPSDPRTSPHLASESAGGSDDASLWSGAARGEPRARARLGELVGQVARLELLRRGVPAGELGDLVQETQRTSFAFLERNPLPPKDLGTFLKYRAWGVLSDFRKKMRSSRLDFRDDLEPLGRVPAARPAVDRLRAAEIESALAECRRRLPAELARVLGLRYDTQLDTEAIRKRLGVHRNTIHVRVFRALERLRDCMGAKGFGPEDLA